MNSSSDNSLEGDFKYRGKSKGLVDDCGFCEHCGKLSRGTAWFSTAGGVDWCLHCLACESNIYYDPVSDSIFDDVFEVDWNEYVILIGEL